MRHYMEEVNLGLCYFLQQFRTLVCTLIFKKKTTQQTT